MISRLEDLADTANKQNETIDKLSTKLRFVLSYLDIQQDDKSYIDWSSNEWPDLASAKSYGLGANGDVSTHSAAAAKQPAKTMQEELLSAVYVEQSEKQKRSINFVVAGLQEKYDSENDKDSDREQLLHCANLSYCCHAESRPSTRVTIGHDC